MLNMSKAGFFVGGISIKNDRENETEDYSNN